MSLRALQPEERTHAREAWRRDRAVLLSRWLGGQALQVLLRAAQGPWVPESTTGAAFNFWVVPADLASWSAIFEDPALLEQIGQIVDLPGLARFEGQIKRLDGTVDQRFPWHRDHRHGQLLGLSVNLSPEPYQGGAFEQRLRWEREPTVRLCPRHPGDVHLIDVADPTRVHRIAPVIGEVPRIFLAGWFYAS